MMDEGKEGGDVLLPENSKNSHVRPAVESFVEEAAATGTTETGEQQHQQQHHPEPSSLSCETGESRQQAQKKQQSQSSTASAEECSRSRRCSVGQERDTPTVKEADELQKVQQPEDESKAVSAAEAVAAADESRAEENVVEGIAEEVGAAAEEKKKTETKTSGEDTVTTAGEDAAAATAAEEKALNASNCSSSRGAENDSPAQPGGGERAASAPVKMEQQQAQQQTQQQQQAQQQPPQPQAQDPFGAGRGPFSRKRKADAFLPDGDAETMDRLKKKLESLTKEQMKILLAKACVQYPAVEMALNSVIEADPASRRLMVRNVAFTTTEQALRQKLEAYGEIEDFKLVVERTSGQNKGFAFVTYRSMESVQHILSQDVVVDGRHLAVKLASQQDPINAFKRSFPGVVPSCRLFVRNVPDTCDDERLRDEFSVFGEIREAVIIRSKDGKSKGYGFVVFEEPEALMKATCQSQRVIDGQVTFVSVASETPRRNGQQHPGSQQQQQQQLRTSSGVPNTPAGGWPITQDSSMYMMNTGQGNTPLAAAAAAAAANPYVQQMAALSPSLYMQQYQQHFMAASQVNAAVAAVTSQQQQPMGATTAQALQQSQHAQSTLR